MQIDFEQYHIAKSLLIEEIEKMEGTDAASDAMSIIESLEISMQNQIERIVLDKSNAMSKIKNLIQAI